MPSTSILVSKLQGSLYWLMGDEEAAAIDIERGIIRAEDGGLLLLLSFYFWTDGQRYLYETCLKTSDSIRGEFKGPFTFYTDKVFKERRIAGQGVAYCRLSQTKKGYGLKGGWSENGTSYAWSGELDQVDHFQDEKSAVPS